MALMSLAVAVKAPPMPMAREPTPIFRKAAAVVPVLVRSAASATEDAEQQALPAELQFMVFHGVVSSYLMSANLRIFSPTPGASIWAM